MDTPLLIAQLLREHVRRLAGDQHRQDAVNAPAVRLFEAAQFLHAPLGLLCGLGEDQDQKVRVHQRLLKRIVQIPAGRQLGGIAEDAVDALSFRDALRRAIALQQVLHLLGHRLIAFQMPIGNKCVVVSLLFHRFPSLPGRDFSHGLSCRQAIEKEACALNTRLCQSVGLLGEVRIDQFRQSRNGLFLVGAVGNNGNGGALHDPEGKNAQKAFVFTRSSSFSTQM